jgi:anti-sigma-K factor RskA
MTSDRIDELIALAALGELSEAEERELDEAAADDPFVAAEFDEAIAAAAALQRVHVEQPPAALRSSLMDAIASTPQEPPVDRPIDEWAPTPAVSLEQQRRRRRSGPVILAAAAAIAFFVVGGVALIAVNDSGSDPIAAVVDASDATSRQLDGEIQGLTVVYSATEQALVVEGADVPVLGDDATYQLWLVGDDGATSVGTFGTAADGTVSERFSDADPTGFVLGVTREPAGGSESPTLPILASA